MSHHKPLEMSSIHHSWCTICPSLIILRPLLMSYIPLLMYHIPSLTIHRPLLLMRYIMLLMCHIPHPDESQTSPIELYTTLLMRCTLLLMCQYWSWCANTLTGYKPFFMCCIYPLNSEKTCMYHISHHYIPFIPSVMSHNPYNIHRPPLICHLPLSSALYSSLDAL